jgi:hypothetical protein
MIPYVDRWSSTSKVALFAVGAIPPIVFIIFWFVVNIMVFIHNCRVDRKYAALNAKALAEKKNK